MEWYERAAKWEASTVIQKHHKKIISNRVKNNRKSNLRKSLDRIQIMLDADRLRVSLAKLDKLIKQ